MLRRTLPAAMSLALLAGCSPSWSGPQTQVVGHIAHPDKLDPTPDRLADLDIASGFRVAKFAEGLRKPRMLAFGEDGTLYVSRRDDGDVLAIRDDNRDGRGDEPRTFIKLDGVHGLAVRGRNIYATTVRQVYEIPLEPNGSAGTIKKVLDELPEGAQHPNRTIAFGPDRMLYVSIGSSCNDCMETNPEHATILMANPADWSRMVYAKGLRNTIGFAWHPRTGEMWGVDHGIDWLGDDAQPEELNRIERGRNYGWPFVFGTSQWNPTREPPPGKTKDQVLSESTSMAMGYTAHAAPMAMTFLDKADVPDDWKEDALVAMHGSWNRVPPSGYEIVRIRFENGRPVAIEPFITGFLTSSGQFGRPCGIAVAPDGSIYFSDDGHGVIYRVTRAK